MTCFLLYHKKQCFLIMNWIENYLKRHKESHFSVFHSQPQQSAHQEINWKSVELLLTPLTSLIPLHIGIIENLHIDR